MIKTAGVLSLVFVVASLVPAPARAASADTVCVIEDDRLRELSGLVTTADGYVTVNDGSKKADRRKIFYLDADCQVTRTVDYPSEPADTEDLAIAPDGTLWVGDFGDNDTERDTIGLWELAPGATVPELHTVSYPDGPHNAETMVLGGDGRPVIITKSADGAQVYTYTGAEQPLRSDGPVSFPATSTDNPRGKEGRRLLTGGTNSPDGTTVVIRTYADAFAFKVTEGDVVAALKSGSPAVIPLPDEPQGEAIAYSRDGRFLLTVSEADGKKDQPTILRYAAQPAAGSDPARTWLWAGGAGAVALAGIALLIRRRVSS